MKRKRKKKTHPKSKLMLGDCLKKMPKLAAHSFDLVLCDPPYGTTACKWDSVIPLVPMWKNLERLVKSNAAIVMTASQPFTTTLISSNQKRFKYCWVWHKTRPTGFSHSKNMPLKDYEDIAVFSQGSIGHLNLLGKDKRMLYYPQGVRSTLKKVSRTTKGFSGSMERASQTNTYVANKENFPRMVLSISSEGHSTHPTQKPVALMEYLIKTYTNKGDRVLDFAMGSGTTGVACKKLNRKFVGIELDESYFEIAKKRIEETCENETKK
jgi:site-specific DNA-methyltransferase (adenine-specific)